MKRSILRAFLFCSVVAGAAGGSISLASEGIAATPGADLIECDSSSDPCVRVYKSLKAVEEQSYQVVRFTEAEIYQSIDKDGGMSLHRKIKDETGFDCKKGKYEYGYFRCEEGALVTRHDLLIKILSGIYG